MHYIYNTTILMGFCRTWLDLEACKVRFFGLFKHAHTVISSSLPAVTLYVHVCVLVCMNIYGQADVSMSYLLCAKIMR